MRKEATAAEPAEFRGVARDQVRLLVATPERLVHTQFLDLDRHLEPGDVLVVNTSQTLPAALDARRGGDPIVVHLATNLEGDIWTVELRRHPDGSTPILDAQVGEKLELPGGSTLRLLSPYPHSGSGPRGRGNRLWRARLTSTADPLNLMKQFGRPISYGYLAARVPLSYYQTIFGVHPGSAEMPSAARPFSGALLARLVARGVLVLPVTLHAGVSSQEAGEGPAQEWFSVPESTAVHLNLARQAGSRVVAVGTTVTRALESATAEDGTVRPDSGWTSLVIGPNHPVRVVGGLITGLHDPQASHLLLVEAVAGAAITQRVYEAATSEDYRWHEFGDSCLLLP